LKNCFSKKKNFFFSKVANENDSTKNQLDGSEILEADVTILEGHSSEVLSYSISIFFFFF